MSLNQNTAAAQNTTPIPPAKRFANRNQIIGLAIYFAFTGILLLQNVYNFWPDSEEISKDKSLSILSIEQNIQSLKVKMKEEPSDSTQPRLGETIQALDSIRHVLLTQQEQNIPHKQQICFRVLFFKCTSFSADRDHSLLLLVLIMGAVGSWLHALSSFLDFVGNRNFVTSWIAWYLMRPILGAMMAVIFYVVIRAGFFSQSIEGLKAINPFSIAALAGLVGLFTQRATKKLADVFDALFPTNKKDLDSLDATNSPATISKLNPEKVTVGATSLLVQVTGTNFTEKSIAFVNGNARNTSFKSKETLEFSLLPEDVANAGELQITVKDPTLDLEPGNSMILPIVEQTA
jgi:hypothetical protein